MAGERTTAPAIRTFRFACPHYCHDSCGGIATVVDGHLRKVEGDPLHPVTRGQLCGKAYSYVDRVYSPDRLRHPLIQSPRGSGRWQRVTWDEALDQIAAKLIDLQERYGSLLPLCLYASTGTGGVLHRAPEGLFGSMGPYTRAANTHCYATGRDAQVYDFGALRTSDPSELLGARTIFLWGVNPAWTAVHQMSLLLEAQDRGARLVVVDPLATATAAHADLHLQLRPGTDGALALGMAREILDAGWHDPAFLEAHVQGWAEFAAYLRERVTVTWAAAETGLTPEQIRTAARLYAAQGPAMSWIGFGMQRVEHAGQAVRAIDALAAMTGQIGRPGTGVQYIQNSTWIFGRHLRSFGPAPDHSHRPVSSGDIARTVRELHGPPVRMFWVAGANPAAQAPDGKAVAELLREMELVVVVDQFMTRTAQLADIVLPATTLFERWDLTHSGWHHYLQINEKAIEPLYESRSDLAIAWALSAKLNERKPGCCPFPQSGDEREWVSLEWGEQAWELFGLDDPEALRDGPVRARIPRVAWAELDFPTPSGRIELYSERALAACLPALPEYLAPRPAPPAYPLRLLTPRTAESHNSQFHCQAWVLRVSSRPFAEIHPDLAGRLGLADGDIARIYNERGELRLLVRLTRTVPPDCVVAYVAAYRDHPYPLNELVGAVPASMGSELSAFPGIAFGDTFVAVERSEGEEGP